MAAGLVSTIQRHMTDGSSKNGLPADLAGTLSDGCEPYFAFLALKKLDNHLEGHGLLEFAQPFSKTVDAFVEYAGELKKSAVRSKKSAERSAMMLSATHPKLAAFVGMFAKDKVPSGGSEIQAPKTAPSDEAEVPRWLLDAPIKLKRVSCGRPEGATMHAEVSELTPFETSFKVGHSDSTTK